MTEALTRVDLRGRVALAGKVGDQKALLHLAKKCRGDDRPECPTRDDFESELKTGPSIKKEVGRVSQ
jgi:hypothetical protein